ncbi:MAG: hypothetical protein H0X24_02700 [Ktedonobacterales bacterium]|nr:hypothetical protein [Ktedonobacterales bacterium]
MRTMPLRRRARYLARKKAHYLSLLRTRLEEVAHQDLRQLPPTSRERLLRSLERMPREIPAELVAALHHRLLEVAA